MTIPTDHDVSGSSPHIPDATCSFCGKSDHKESRCFKKKPMLKQARKKFKGDFINGWQDAPSFNRVPIILSAIFFNGSEVHLNLSEETTIIQPSTTHKSDTTPGIITEWLLGSAAQISLTNKKEVFSTFRPVDQLVTVEGGFGGKIEIKGNGTVELELESGYTIILPNVGFAPEVQGETMSMSRLLQGTEYKVKFGRGWIVCKSDGQVVAEAVERWNVPFIRGWSKMH